MSDIAIRVDGLGKEYKIGALQSGHKSLQYRSLRDSIANTARSLISRSGRPPAEERFWALKDVSFEVKRGEVVGVIGRNGAGKSTLLKILSRITEPTTGRAEIHGRVGSLLEVGTGFHPELSGRDNIYLNGAILGMRRAEIDKHFDAIVAFAEVEKFVDTPVKHYSSGMYLRLAFAVAAHLEPEILIVDEVLAVGDMQFQKKCLSKMGETAREGRTVLMVSHNLAAVEALCSVSMLLASGQLASFDETHAVLDAYSNSQGAAHTATVNLRGARRAPGLKPSMQTVRLRSAGVLMNEVRMGSPLEVEVDFRTDGFKVKPILGLLIKTSLGAPVFTVNNRFAADRCGPETIDEGTICCAMDGPPLMPGLYRINLYLGGPQHYDFDVVEDAVSFTVTPADVFASGKLPPPTGSPIFQQATFTARRNGSDGASPGLRGGDLAQ